MAKLIEIKKGEQVLHVTEKAFRVVYEGHGYHKIGEVEVKAAEKLQGDVDFLQLSESELKKINKEELQAFLDKEGIEYEATAKKDELIKIILGEE